MGVGLSALWGWVKDIVKGVATSVAAFFAGAWWEKEKSRRKRAEQRLEDIEDAKAIHDRVDNNPEYRDRVRDRYR